MKIKREKPKNEEIMIIKTFKFEFWSIVGMDEVTESNGKVSFMPKSL